jgi:hypothetical protein
MTSAEQLSESADHPPRLIPSCLNRKLYLHHMKSMLDLFLPLLSARALCGSNFRATQQAIVLAMLCALVLLPLASAGQTLVNVDFGAGGVSGKTGFAATGQRTNDFWNRYRHYEPKFTPGAPHVADGRLEGLKLADGSRLEAALTVTNAPGVWGNATGDPMFDSYIFAPNGSNMVVTLTGLETGRYHFYLYGHAEADASGEQNSVFTLRAGTNRFGPLAPTGATGWQMGHSWREGAQFIVFRDVPVAPNEPVTIEVAPGPGGIAVLNGLQVLSRGTAPPRLARPETTPSPAGWTNLLFREVRYNGTISPAGARFSVIIDAESRQTNELSAVLFEGDLALLNPKLPSGWRIVNQGRKFILLATEPGSHQLELELTAKIHRAEPWNQIVFTGPPAAIASVSVRATVPDTEVQLQSGTALETHDKALAHGVLGADRQLSLRWQSKTSEVTREALVTVNSTVAAHLAPSVIRYTSKFDCTVLQARLSRLRFTLPPDHTLTRLEGEGVRDWQLTPGPEPMLAVEFIRPIETGTTLTLVTEQIPSSLPARLELAFPQPLAIQRERGALRLTSEDLSVRVGNTTNLRQVNAQPGEVAAYNYSLRPASLDVQLQRIEPVLTVASRVHASLEESRLLVRHSLSLDAAKAGIYTLDLTPQSGFMVAEVRGESVDDWKVANGQLRVSFARRLLGAQALTVLLEQALTNTVPEFVIEPLRVTGAAKETAWVGARSNPGLLVKTAILEGLREIPVTALPDRQDELLAFRAEQGDWRATLSAERLAPRMVAEVFNLLTIGDGLVGGSATIRYAIFNQGVQQFRVRLPAHWRNIEFTGLNLRRKDQQDGVWTISLQDKAWGGYTLVITYDYALDPKRATIDAAGAHPLEVERESGAVAITTAAGLAIEPGPVAAPLRGIDPTQLAEADRALISRPVLLAYRYEGYDFALRLEATRHEEVALLDAVADRAQLTSVLTDTGEMLTQASFMVKNNERQFQRFQLPHGAMLWGVAVNGQPVKAEEDGDWLLVSLPRGADRDQVFAVDLKYAQQFGKLGTLWPRPTQLVAPRTDLPGTYAEWEVFVPSSKRVTGFGGNMTVARGATYGFREGWHEFVRVYRGLWHDYGAGLIFGGGLIGFVAALVLWGRRNGFQGVAAVCAIFCVLAILAGMMLPALSKAKAKAQQIKSINNLKNIGLAARIYASDNDGRLPNSFEEMMAELATDRILFDPNTGERYTYIGAGKIESDPHAILAYSSEKGGRREVVMGDGSVQVVTTARFGELLANEAAGKMTVLMDPELAKRYGGTLGSAAAPVPSATAAPEQAAPAQRTNTALAEMDQNRAIGAVSTSSLDAPVIPTATGLRSLKIDVPKTGRALQFTRVLNMSGEPPSVRLSLTSTRAYVAGQMLFQLSAFLAGLAIVFYQWRQPNPSSLWLAIGAALALLGTAYLFIAWRALGLALIMSVPTLLALFLAWITWRFLHREPSSHEVAPAASALSASPVPPVVGGLLILLVSAAQTLATQTTTTLRHPAISIVSASYAGATHERVAQIDATLEFLSAATNCTVALFGQEVAIQEFTVLKGEAQLWREHEKIGLWLPDRGPVVVRMKLLVKLEETAGRRRLELSIPPALGSQLSLLLDEPEAEIEFPAAVAFQRVVSDNQTRIEAVLGATDRLALAWTPRLKRASEVEATAFAQQTAVVTFSGAAVSTRSVLDYQITQGELRQLRLALPASHRVLRVAGDLVRSWDLAETNRSTMLVELLKGAAGSARVIVDTEVALDPSSATVRVLLPAPLDVQRASGMVAVRADEELGLTVERAGGLDRVEPAEFARLLGEPGAKASSAWRFLRPEFDLAVRVELLQPRIEAAIHHQFTVGLEEVAIGARVDYTISRAGLFSVRLALPAETRIESVASPAMRTWSERVENGRRLLEVILNERTLGALALDLQLRQPLTDLPPALVLDSVHPLGLDKLHGYISVASETGLGLKTAALAGLTEIPASALPGPAGAGAGWLAFKYLANEPAPDAPWTLSLATELIESWVRAEIFHSITVGETLTSGRTMVRYEIQNAPIKELRLRTPAVWQNVEFSGAGIRRRDRTNDVWRVELQHRVRGEYRLTVVWEMPRKAGANEVALTGLEALNVERETGALSLHAQAPLQLTFKEFRGDLVRVDARELPDWAQSVPAGATSSTAVLAYRYLRPGWELTLEAQRFSEAALLQALIENARLRTVVADDGQLMTQMELTVRNNGRQHLEVTLPSGAKIWSAFVAGQPVRPARRGDRLLLPLDGLGADAPVSVDLIYVSQGRFPSRRGKVELASPGLDMPMKDTRWELFLPPDYVYDKFAGSMTYEQADLLPMAQDFTLAEYRRQHAAQEASLEAQAVDFIRKARGEMAAGRHKDGAQRLNLFVGANLRDEKAKRELQQLEEEVNRNQLSNLIQAQQAWNFDNSPRFGLDIAEPGSPPEPQPAFGYDTKVLERQVTQLQRAQAVALTRVTPLRVSLPTRGVRHSFAQVLQTEINKPLTITLAAANDRQMGWLKTIALGSGGFIILWILAAAAIARRPQNE